MTKSTPGQRKTESRVMHEFKHGELKSGSAGKGGKVTSRRQAVAIALKEAGASKYEGKDQNKKNFARTRAKEARGETAQQEAESKSKASVGDSRKTSPAKSRTNSTRASKSSKAAKPV